MIKGELPVNESERLEELESYQIMDSNIEEDFDNLTKLAAVICETNISLVSLLDGKRQWFKSRHGLDAEETPRELAFCGHAIHEMNKVFVVNDAREDIRFHDNPLVTGNPHVIFYAGVPLVTENGYPLGTLCVIDDKPKTLTERQLTALRVLSDQVMNLIELRKKRHSLRYQKELLERKNKEIDMFAYAAAHDLKAPVINITQLSNMLLEDDALKGNSDEILGMIMESSERLTRLIEQLLEFSKIDKITLDHKSEVTPQFLIDDVKSVIKIDDTCTLNLITDLTHLKVNTTGLGLILQNLVSNAIKYGDKPITVIDIGITETEKYYEFYVKDNGPGIDGKYHEKVFEPFVVLTTGDRFGKRGSGLGLANVQKIVEKMDGVISMESEVGQGAKFKFTIKK